MTKTHYISRDGGRVVFTAPAVTSLIRAMKHAAKLRRMGLSARVRPYGHKGLIPLYQVWWTPKAKEN